MTFFFFVSRPNFLGNQCESAKKTNKPAKKKQKKRITIVDTVGEAERSRFEQVDYRWTGANRRGLGPPCWHPRLHSALLSFAEALAHRHVWHRLEMQRKHSGRPLRCFFVHFQTPRSRWQSGRTRPVIGRCAEQEAMAKPPTPSSPPRPESHQQKLEAEGTLWETLLAGAPWNPLL